MKSEKHEPVPFQSRYVYADFLRKLIVDVFYGVSHLTSQTRKVSYVRRHKRAGKQALKAVESSIKANENVTTV